MIEQAETARRLLDLHRGVAPQARQPMPDHRDSSA